MSTKYLGHAFDIHGGGVDLVFPHHENEIAQAQAAGKPFAKHWIHNGLLTVNGEKMSKSLGNFITVDQALKDAGHVDALKMFFLGTHYRSPLDYTERNVEAAAKRWDRLWHFLSQVERAREAAHGASSKLPQEVRQVQDEFEQVLDDDLNTPRALAVLDRLAEIGFQWVGSWDKEAEPRALRDQILSAGDMMRKLGGVLGLMFRQADFTTGPAGPSAEDKNLLEEYKRARKAKDFSKSDRLRKQLIEKGFAVQDRGDDSILMPRR
jgi:cysteinyl-tRNA synthetase